MKCPTLIKWTGSKRHIAEQIIEHFPKSIDTYYEPFLGGGSVFLRLLSTSKISVNHFVLSDLNKSLIEIFKTVKDDPQRLIDSYSEQWNSLQRDGEFYYKQREAFNKTKNPLIFYFLTRTCYNGTIRFNRHGDFNVGFHFGRKGMEPKKLKISLIIILI